MILKEFQTQAVQRLIDSTFNDKQTILVKSPTGSGKTIILLNFINEYLNKINKNTAFVWLTPGTGDLEVQSMNKMKAFFPQRKIQDLPLALIDGFVPGSTTFINWEMVTKTGNRAITVGEKTNLFGKIAEAQRANVDFIIIIDEEHSNNTSKAKDVIDAIYAKKIIRMSATTLQNPKYEFYNIDEADVIGAGLISKIIRINDGINPGDTLGDDYDRLLVLADDKRKQIQEEYLKIGSNVRPLVLIQFPNAQPKIIKLVEQKLESMGYTYTNGMVAKWTSDEKINLSDNLTKNDGEPIFILMKQAITKGWDCPRAKILVKLREGMEQNFEIQTIGRIRRMPELKHYDNNLLDYCYVYTYDEKWKSGLIKSVDKAYEFVRLFLNDRCKEFKLTKQLKNLDIDTGFGERETLQCLFKYFKETYRISGAKDKNAKILEANGYIFGTQLKSKLLHGDFSKLMNVGVDFSKFIDINREVNPHQHGILLQHSIDQLKKIINLPWTKTHVVLKKMFRSNSVSFYKICNLETKEFYAFIINNIEKLKSDFVLATAQVFKQNMLVLKPKEVEFKIPLADEFKYDSLAKKIVDWSKNAYKDYTSACCTSRIKSNCEVLFEKYCANNKNLDWFYKNGDSGQDYFSIVYLNSLNKQLLFYPDYILKMKNGDVWIIETKGGEINGENKNIDIQIENKFNAFKEYAKNKNIKWGFVRYEDQSLYINNTVFSIDMKNEAWVPIEDVLN